MTKRQEFLPAKNNSSGFTGVCFDKNANKWRVDIRVDGKLIYGGLFDILSDAIDRRKEMNIEYGFHKNHGRK